MIQLCIENAVIKSIRFDGACCAVTTAASSLVCDALTGAAVSDLDNLDLDWILGQLEANLPRSRFDCAELPLVAAREAVHG